MRRIIRTISLGAAGVVAATALGVSASAAMSGPAWASSSAGSAPAKPAQAGGTCALQPGTSYSYRNFDFKLGGCNGKDLHGIRFNQVSLAGANFSGSNLEGATFTAHDSYTIINGSSLKEANLSGARFYRVLGERRTSPVPTWRGRTSTRSTSPVTTSIGRTSKVRASTESPPGTGDGPGRTSPGQPSWSRTSAGAASSTPS
jgi:hypothetical protein